MFDNLLERLKEREMLRKREENFKDLLQESNETFIDELDSKMSVKYSEKADKYGLL